MGERFKPAVLKTVVPKGTGGSNPSLSAEINVEIKKKNVDEVDKYILVVALTIIQL